MPPIGSELRATFGDIDIYLFDQFLRGRFDTRRRILDAGCGDGRNLVFLLAHGYECFAVDRDASGVAAVRALMARLAPRLSPDHAQTAELTALPFADASMDAVICSAVLHFATDLAHWTAMVDELWRVLAPGGLLFARLASTIGLEAAIGNAPARLRLPDGSERFVVTSALLEETTARLGGTLADPIKTTNVHGMRAMTTWVVAKPT